MLRFAHSADVAQLVERGFRKAQVDSSNLSVGSHRNHPRKPQVVGSSPTLGSGVLWLVTVASVRYLNSVPARILGGDIFRLHVVRKD